MIITAIYASLMTILFITLSARIIVVRRSNKISLGDGEDDTLLRRTRAHGNCAEFAPFGLILLGIAETLGTNAILLHVIGILLLAGRIGHAYGVGGPKMNFTWRTRGMIMTFTSLALAAAVNLITALLSAI